MKSLYTYTYIVMYNYIAVSMTMCKGNISLGAMALITNKISVCLFFFHINKFTL